MIYTVELIKFYFEEEGFQTVISLTGQEFFGQGGRVPA